MDPIQPGSPAAHASVGMLNLIANAATFQAERGVNSFDEAKEFIHVVEHLPETSGEYERPSALVEFPSDTSYNTIKPGHPEGSIRVRFEKDVSSEYAESGRDAWIEFANFADKVVQEIICLADPRAPVTNDATLQLREIRQDGPFTRSRVNVEDDYYMGQYVAIFGLR